MSTTPDALKALATRKGGIVNRLMAGELKLPDEITQLINVQSWARALLLREDYDEPNPEYLQTLILMQTAMSGTLEEVFDNAGIRSLQKSVPNVPGGSTGAIEIYDLYVTGSDFGEGAKTYLILGVRDMETGAEVKYTTGAQQVQMQIMAAICFGVWPFRCKITRTERKDKGGKFLFWVFPPDAE